MYKIIGSDGREYGPVGAEELREWIREGRANAQSRVRLDGATEWQMLGTIQEFAASLGAPSPSSPPPPISPAPISIPRTPSQKTNGLAIAGFVCSLLGIPCACFSPFPILGLVFSLIGLSQINRNPQYTGRGMAIAGIILSSLLLVMAVGFWVLALLGAFPNLSTMFD